MDAGHVIEKEAVESASGDSKRLEEQLKALPKRQDLWRKQLNDYTSDQPLFGPATKHMPAQIRRDIENYDRDITVLDLLINVENTEEVDQTAKKSVLDQVRKFRKS